MYLIVLAAFVLAYSLREVPAPAGYVPEVTLKAVIVLTAAAGLIGGLVPIVAVRRGRLTSARVAVLRRFMPFQLGLSLGVFAYEIFGLGWQALVRGLFLPREPILLGDALLMAPFLVMLFGSLVGFHRIDVAVRGTPWTLGQYLAYNTRRLLLPLAVWFGVLAGVDAVERTGVTGEFGSRYPALYWLGGTGVIAAVALFLPFIIRLVWGLKPLPPGKLREELESLARKMGLKYRDILILPTYGGVVNAGVTGIWGPFRYIILTDALVAHLAPDELEAVFQHELAHIRCRHIQSYLLLSASFVAFSVAYWTFFSQFEGGWGWVGLGIFIYCAAVYWGVLFGLVSRRFEREADLYAAKATSPEALTSALGKIALLSGGRRAWSWRHSSVEDRVAFLARVVEEPDAEEEFRASLRRVKRISYALMAASAVSLVASALLALEFPPM